MNDYYGLPIGILENDSLRIEYLKTAGPRIVRLSYKGEPNLLAELPDAHTETPLGTYYFRGGHRLWCAPESLTNSYVPDNDGLHVKEFSGGVRLTGQPEPATGIVKTIEIRLAAERASVTLWHELYNSGSQAVATAGWEQRCLWFATKPPAGAVAICAYPRLSLDIGR